jgi:hypothetical protein
MWQGWPHTDDEGTYTVTLEWRSRRVSETEAGTPVGAVRSRTWPASARLAHAILRIMEASAPAGGGEGEGGAYLPGSGWGEGEGDAFRQGAVAEDEPEPEDVERASD